MACLPSRFLPTFLAQAPRLSSEAIGGRGQVTIVAILLQTVLQRLHLLLELAHLLLLYADLLLQGPDHLLLHATLLLQGPNHFLLDLTLLLQQTDVLSL